MYGNGLAMSWFGNVWLNPPFDDTALWIKKFYTEVALGRVDQAMLLVNSNHGYNWYEELWRKSPVCCARERIEFLTDYNELDIRAKRAKAVKVGDQTLMVKGQAKRGQTFVYYGPNVDLFAKVFIPIGRVIIPKKVG